MLLSTGCCETVLGAVAEKLWLFGCLLLIDQFLHVNYLTDFGSGIEQ